MKYESSAPRKTTQRVESPIRWDTPASLSTVKTREGTQANTSQYDAVRMFHKFQSEYMLTQLLTLTTKHVKSHQLRIRPVLCEFLQRINALYQIVRYLLLRPVPQEQFQQPIHGPSCTSCEGLNHMAKRMSLSESSHASDENVGTYHPVPNPHEKDRK